METAKIVFLIISSIIGAGFISGKEIYVYFSNFGICGLFLIIPLFFLLYFFIKLLLDVSQKYESKNFDSFVFKKQKVYNIFCFVSFSIISAAMFAGINSVFNFDVFSIQYIILYCIVFSLCIFILFLGFDKFLTINIYFMPIIIIVFVITILSAPFESIYIESHNNLLIAPYSLVIYACINVFLSHYIILNCSKNLNKNQIKKTSFWCSFIICFMITLCIICELCCPEICQYDMPFLYIAKNLSFGFYIIYCIIIIYCILSTLLSSLYSLKSFFKFKNKGANVIAPIIISFCLSLFGFPNFIKYLYPIIGFFGLFMFFKLLYFNKKL